MNFGILKGKVNGELHWINHKSNIEIYPPIEFNFEECLIFLKRSNQEVLHQVKNDYLYKLLKVKQELVLLQIGVSAHTIQVEFPLGKPSEAICEEVADYIWKWFDLDNDLKSFYEMAKNDKVLQSLIPKYYGLRIIGIPDLFEALTWAVIGQQINLTFAYTLKRRLIEHFGESLEWEGETYWLYPSYQTIASLSVDDLKKLQFSTRKAEYVIGIANEMSTNSLSKENLLKKQDYQQMHATLMSLRGVGAWTADYVLMKCFNQPTAFPIADVGLHNALKVQLGLKQKPTIEEIQVLAKNWNGWQAYATFYLWRSLYEQAV